MAVGKKLRWEIFRRDNFACRYCGRSIQDGAVLEVDHVHPRSRRGADVPTNLVTACEACNSGKSDTPISAPPVEDVPQEAFRRACVARGLTDDQILSADPEEPSTLAQQIRQHYTDPEWAELGASRRYWLEEDQDPNEREFEVLVAYEAFLGESRDRHCLERTVESLLLLLPREEVARHEQEALEYFRGLPIDPPTEQERPAVWLGKVAGLLVEERQRIHFAGLSEEEQAEWLEYVSEFYGRHADDDPWRMTPEAQRREAEKKSFLAAAGYFHPAMCRGRGRHIQECPQRAKRLVRIKQCEACGPDGPPEHPGHGFCDEHFQMIVTGEYVTARGVTVIAASHTDIAAGA